jgi:hypothetical protein
MRVLICTYCGAEDVDVDKNENKDCTICENGFMQSHELTTMQINEIIDDMRGDAINDEERGK